jgi:hypothetical protein
LKLKVQYCNKIKNYLAALYASSQNKNYNKNYVLSKIVTSKNCSRGFKFLSLYCTMSQIIKNKPGQIIQVRQKVLIVNAYTTLKSKHPNYSKTHILDEVSGQTGISDKTIRKVLNEYDATGNKNIIPKITCK